MILQKTGISSDNIVAIGISDQMAGINLMPHIKMYLKAEYDASTRNVLELT
jgi:hypothetical protein